MSLHPGAEQTLRLIPVSLSDADVYITAHHRHHGPLGGLRSYFAVGVGHDEICGVAVVGPPVARMLNDGWTAEVTRLCTDGTRNACSMLYGAAWRACRALGYRKLITYTLPEEGGSSLRAAGWRLIGEAGGGSWHRENRPRVDRHPTQLKLKWEVTERDGAGSAAPPDQKSTAAIAPLPQPVVQAGQQTTANEGTRCR